MFNSNLGLRSTHRFLLTLLTSNPFFYLVDDVVQLAEPHRKVGARVTRNGPETKTKNNNNQTKKGITTKINKKCIASKKCAHKRTVHKQTEQMTSENENKIGHAV